MPGMMRTMMLAGLVTCLFAGPAAAQYKMKVEPAPLKVTVGEALPLTIHTTGRRGGWRESPGGDWHTLLQPEGVARVEIRSGKLTLIGLKPGTAKFHVWHRTSLSWQGLYQVLELTVEKKVVRPEPRPEPRPGRFSMLRLYRLDQGLPQPVHADEVTPVFAGQRIRFGLYAFDRSRRAIVPGAPRISDATRSCEVVAPKDHRFTLHFPARLPAGTEVAVTIADGRTGQREVYRFRVAGASVRRLTVWFKAGVDGEWERADERVLRVGPGQVVSIAVRGLVRGMGDAVVPAQARLVGGALSQLRKVGPGQWMLITGFASKQPIPGRIEVSSSLARDGAALAFEIAR